jgi:uncharacterized BrkB/YihY/UPF0761 family membrane protein
MATSSSSVEYDDIYSTTMQSTIYNNDDEYTTLMNKENVVLDTVNRVVNQVETAKHNQSMVDTPVNIVVYRVFKTMTTIFKEIYERKPLGEVFREERRLYVGLFIVFCSVCFIILYKT